MEPKDDNFTCPETTTFGEPLTLRDRFAIAAMPKMAWGDFEPEQCAADCYLIADAMLKARDAK